MKRFNLIAATFVFAALFSVSAFAQAAAPAGTTRIGWIETGMFGDDKEGITKYNNAVKALEAEMKPQVTYLQNLQAKLKAISEELAKMQNPQIPVNQQAAAAKQEEGQRLQREFEFKKKEYDAALEAGSNRVLGPVSADIGKAIQEFAKNKGYSVVLDIDKLAQANIILALDQSANITKEFITFYNARPGSTATTATPR